MFVTNVILNQILDRGFFWNLKEATYHTGSSQGQNLETPQQHCVLWRRRSDLQHRRLQEWTFSFFHWFPVNCGDVMWSTRGQDPIGNLPNALQLGISPMRKTMYMNMPPTPKMGRGVDTNLLTKNTRWRCGSVRVWKTTCMRVILGWPWPSVHSKVWEFTCAEHLTWLMNHHPSSFEEEEWDSILLQWGIPECMPEQYDVRVLLTHIRCTTWWRRSIC